MIFNLLTGKIFIFYIELSKLKYGSITYIDIVAEPSSTDDANVNGGTKALPNNYNKVISDIFYRILMKSHQMKIINFQDFRKMTVIIITTL